MNRLYSLDFLRAFAMLLGLAVHAPLIFYDPTILIEFGIHNKPQTEQWIWIILGFITNWRMPLFFLLSGFFSIMLIQKRGLLKFLSDRIIRIGLTCLLFCSIFDLLDGRLDFTLDHLWFLYYLLIFAFCFSILQQVQFIKDLLIHSVSSITFFMLLFWLVMTVPLAVLLNAEHNAEFNLFMIFDPPKTYTDLKIGNLIYYFSYFLTGSLIYSNKNLFGHLAQNKILIMLSFISTLAFIFQLINYNSAPLIQALLKGINTLFWCLLFLGLATRFVNKSSRLLKWLVELSYPIYLLHVMPIIFVSVGFYVAGFNQLYIVLFSIISSFAISIIFYYLLIKFTPLNWLVNGYSKSIIKLKL